MGYDAMLPLVKDPAKGWAEVTSARAAIKQDLLILLLTSPGEKIMDLEFGVGLRRFLFEPLTRSTLGSLETRIRSQIAKYLPFIKITELSFTSPLDSVSNALITDMDENTIAIKMSYTYGRGVVDEIMVSP